MHAQEERALCATAAAHTRERESNDELLFGDFVHTHSLALQLLSYSQPWPRARRSRRPMRPTRAPHTRSDLRDPSVAAFGALYLSPPAAMAPAEFVHVGALPPSAQLQ
jgi:hypothetical protein